MRVPAHRPRGFARLNVARRLHRAANTPLPTFRANNAVDIPNQTNQPMLDRKRAVRILAKSIFKELTAQGYTDQQIVALATELLSEVTTKMSRSSESAD